MKVLKVLPFTVLLATLLYGPPSRAEDNAVPLAINYQGRVSYLAQEDGGSGRIVDGVYNIAFSLWDSSEGGSQAWSKTFENVGVKNGLFNVVIAGDAENPLLPSLFEGRTLYIGIRIGSGEEMRPRHMLVSVPYSIMSERAKESSTLGGKTAQYFDEQMQTHEQSSSAHHVKTTHFYEMEDQLLESQVPDTVVTGQELQAIMQEHNSDIGAHTSAFNTHNEAEDAHQAAISRHKADTQAHPQYFLVEGGTLRGNVDLESGRSITLNEGFLWLKGGSSLKVKNGGEVGVENGNVNIVNGELNVTPAGNKHSVVLTRTSGYRKFYTLESTEVWMEDSGEDKLSGGRAAVKLDPVFLESVLIDEEHPIRVFVTLEGDCNGVYVSPGAGSFDVIELKGGRSDVPFVYRVMAKSKDLPSARLAPVEKPPAQRRRR